MMSGQNSASAEQVREFVIAGHGNLARVQEMLAANPELLNVSHMWRENDWETAIQGASHVGNADIAEFLLAQGAPLAIYTAAMLGRQDDVESWLDQDPSLINAVGAHGIPLMAHAALSGNVALASLLAQRGAREGMSFALSNAVSRGHREMVRWLLENGAPDLSWLNFQGKTPLAIAVERGDEDMATLLRGRGAEH